LYDARPDQVRQALALIGIEQRVQPRKGGNERTADLLRAFHFQVRSFLRLGQVELGGRCKIGKRTRRTPPFHLGLSALGLQLGEHLRELSRLLLVQLELPGQKPQRTAHAERRARGEIRPIRIRGVRRGMTSVGEHRRPVIAAVRAATRACPPIDETRVHGTSSAGASRARRVKRAGTMPRAVKAA
jgi:hypothetical protein